jgi:hypothetical protein
MDADGRDKLLQSLFFSLRKRRVKALWLGESHTWALLIIQKNL